MMTSLGGANLEAEDKNEPCLFLAASVRGGFISHFELTFWKDSMTSYDPGGGISYSAAG